MARGGKRSGSGRKPRTKEPRVGVMVRMDKTLHEAIKATMNRKSVSGEIEHRLKETAKFPELVRYFGGEEVFALAQMMAHLMSAVGMRSKKSWLDDPYLYDLGMKCAAALLSEFRPDGASVRPAGGMFGLDPVSDDDQVRMLVSGTLLSLRNAADFAPVNRKDADGKTHYFSDELLREPMIKMRLGRLLKRLDRADSCKGAMVDVTALEGKRR